MLEQGPSFTRTHTFSSSHPRQRTEENQLTPWSKLHHSRQRLESLNHCQKTQDHFSKNLWLPSPSMQGKTPDLHVAQCRKEKKPATSGRRIPSELIRLEITIKARAEGSGRREEENATRRSRERGRQSIVTMEIPIKRTRKRPRCSQSARKSPNTERGATKIPQRREEGPRERRSNLAKKGRRRGTCGMKPSSAVVTDGGDLGPLIVNDSDMLEAEAIL